MGSRRALRDERGGYGLTNTFGDALQVRYVLADRVSTAGVGHVRLTEIVYQTFSEQRSNVLRAQRQFRV